LAGDKRRGSHDYGYGNAKNVEQSMEREDAPYVLLAFEEKVADEDAAADEVQKTGLREVFNPNSLEKLDVL
jgi:hypothetical protein